MGKLTENYNQILYIYIHTPSSEKLMLTPKAKGVYLPISKLHSILALSNSLAHDNISEICYCCQNYFIRVQ